ncbi:hypothetical protein ETD86_29455 [Nonomuraea turkmeniaca]|uniref:Uncharacterized protein n=1 Tax=Nonomuraea turkmeniaca TaxID=103838 RepID=A0A5S4FA93_9ACTN|nr:hypothetical protein [Nonomuraea turkmeniaca]TMR14075.1 hypothetical protein ETD86_29455 [Nonomuraea turkmeniaca]
MSTEVRRVPLDFDAPLGAVWRGYVMPDELQLPPCPACRHGFTSAREWLEALAYLLLMLPNETPAAAARKRAHGRSAAMHPFLASLMERPGQRPSDDIEGLTAGLAGRPPRHGDHDDHDVWNATRAIVSAAGLDPDVWGICGRCGGNARIEAYPGQREQADAWQPTPPPPGEGWQLWNTAGDPVPATPVFAKADELVDHLVRHDGYREAAARQIVASGGSAGSLWMIGGQMLHADRDADRIAELRRPESEG